ncbi:MAG: transglycosylase SLT domain-containing protein [Rhodospirillales bacterium]|nr:transglycosylase SLT domain-containing protein [Rhodospirillales bacterium]
MIEPEQIAGLGIIGMALYGLLSIFKKPATTPKETSQPGNAITGVKEQTQSAGSGLKFPSDRKLTDEEVYQLANYMTGHFKRSVDQFDLMTFALVESTFRPWVTRYEPRLNDYSVGLMQTLTTTAAWLYKDMGYRAMGAPSFDRLKDPVVSMYFGAAYIDWLYRAYPEENYEWYIRAYNGGPGHNYNADTTAYYNKWIRTAKQKGWPVNDGITITLG